MSHYTPTQRTSGLSIPQLEALAKNMSIDIDPLDLPIEEMWAEYTRRDRTIRLHPDLGRPQRRCALANLIAHARLRDLSDKPYDSGEDLRMAARMLITPKDWETIRPTWEHRSEGDDLLIFRKFGILPKLLAAYEQTTKVWHPVGCVNWFGLCGNGTDDDIHGFTPTSIKVSGIALHAPIAVVGSPGGDYEVKAGVTVEVDGGLLYGDTTSFEASAEETRKLARFLLDQANAVDLMVQDHNEFTHNASMLRNQLLTVGGEQHG
ncbi:hypothetical protein [Nesterenkonia haasae]|uniref:hypothetical protein n=1 Tax=Nesterenkonia haasae TaxID=2587813 RepID=UPI001390E51F|nr:hypothetical protein [Nesterenkonia haasae]NDK31197.1 hypothetical protein [Nesterenkonia haasae]